MKPLEPGSDRSTRLLIAVMVLGLVCAPLYWLLPEDSPDPGLQVARGLLAPLAGLLTSLLLEGAVGVLGYSLGRAQRWLLRGAAVLGAVGVLLLLEL